MIFIKRISFITAVSICLALTGCSQPQVYGSISMSKGFNNYHGGGGMYGSVSIGGRIR